MASSFFLVYTKSDLLARTIIIIITIIILLILEFFTPTFAASFPLESEWQQVSSSLQDFSQYSDRSQ